MSVPTSRSIAAMSCGLLAGWALTLAACQRVEPKAADTAPPPIITTASGAEMVLIPAGRFRMGASDGQADQQPVHEVQLDAFLLDRYEVTQEQYTKVVSLNGSHFKGPDRPVEMITWANAAVFCNLRSEAEHLTPCYNDDGECNFDADGYRLPTEAEWEYACRAGTESEFSFGADPASLKEHAWFKGNAAKQTHPVGQKQPNAWGLYDMHGNVAEWCNDIYAADYYQTSPTENPRGGKEGDKYVLRGGAWNSSPDSCRSAFRVGQTPGFQDACFALDAIGFRCVRKAPKVPRRSAESQAAASAWPQTVACLGDAQPAALKTGLVYDEIYLKHRTGDSHPERPQRLTAIVERLKKSGTWAELELLTPRPAALEWLTLVHSPEQVAKVKRSAAEGTRPGTGDTPVSADSYDAAVNAAGGVLTAVDAVMAGKIRNAFCAVRPPGHHASRERAMGFCLFNNVAIAARYIQKHHQLAKVLIVDWDVHHGNGTQAVFDEDPNVFYFSVHQSPFYPGTGHAEDRGVGPAQGTKLNVPFPAGRGDRDYRQAFLDKLVPAARQFKPDFILVSAGFDAHQDDTLGSMKLTAAGYAELTSIVKDLAEQHCGGRLVSVLEGGYGLEGLAASVESHLRVLMRPAL